MIADPFGLGVLLYGVRPARVLTAAAWAVGPLAEREFELAHAGCAISTFCKNPLHPGPCKGWKKSLGVNAPGALKAIEAARREKLMAKRAATSEAKSAAEKKLAGAQLHSPLHAKKALIKHANVLLGNDEKKADSKAAKVILNKAEISKYSKIKAAHVQSILTKHGMKDDTGLEDRIAEALAKDNTTGRDDNYRAALRGSAESLGAQLAQQHCKKGDGDCDGKPYEELRAEFADSAEAALLTGDDSHIDTLIEDYNAGDFKPASIAEAKKIAAEMDGAKKAKAAADAPEKPQFSNPQKPLAGTQFPPGHQYGTVAQAGLKDGDKVKLHLVPLTPSTSGKAPYDVGPVDTEGQLVTVKKSGNGYNFLDEDGNQVIGGGNATKWHLSPADGGSFEGPKKTSVTPTKKEPTTQQLVNAVKMHGSEQGDGKKAAAALDAKGLDLDGNPKKAAAPKKAIPAADVPGKFNAKQKNAIAVTKGNVASDADALDAYGALSKEDFDGLDQEHQDAILADLESIQNLVGGSEGDQAEMLFAKFLAKPKASAPSAAPVKAAAPSPAKLDLHEGMTPKQTVDAVEAMTQEDYDALSPTEKMLLAQHLLDAKNAKQPGAAVVTSKVQGMAAASAVKKSPPAVAPLASTSTPPDVSPDAKAAVDYAHGFKSGTAKQKLPAYEKLTGEEFAQLDPNSQKLILADIKGIEGKFLAPAKKKQASDLHNYLSPFAGGGAGAGGGGNPAVATPADKLAAAKSAIPDLAGVTTPGPNPNVPGMQSAFDAMVAKSGNQDLAAEALAPSWAVSALNKLSYLHEHASGAPMIDQKTIDDALPALAADITKKLKGEPGPTPHLDALKKALEFGGQEDATTFLANAAGIGSGSVAGAPVSTLPKSHGTGTAVAGLGTFKPSGFDDYQATTSVAADGVLFSAFKSGHKGSVLSHSNEDIYNNLLAVAQHYAGTSPTESYTSAVHTEFPADLSVLQVAKAVDLKLAKAKGMDNANVLQKKMFDWSQTPAGKQYIAEHTTAGQKWTDNLSGAGVGHVEAAKANLVNGAPVGQRSQKLTPSKNGKAPKYDPAKKPGEFRPLTAQEITASQQDYMDANGANWTPGQAESLANYTTGAYYELNSYLRGETSDGGAIDTISDLGLERIALIQNGMRPLQQDTLLKRGTGWEFVPPEFRNPADIQKLVGKTVQDHAFMSTTVGGEGGNFEDAVMLQIEAPTGTPAAFVKHVSHNDSENEVVLGAGTRFRIVSVVPGTKKSKYDYGEPTVVRVRVVG